MEVSEAEYNSLRTEILHHDGSCLNILGLLLASSTTIYGFVAERKLYPLLIVLSVIWQVGFVYIVEKRFAILRISNYIKTMIEKKEGTFHWETYVDPIKEEEEGDQTLEAALAWLKKQ